MWTHPGETALYSVARGKCDKYSGLEAGPVMCHGALIPRRLSNCPSLLILSDSVKNEFNSERTIRLSHIHAWPYIHGHPYGYSTIYEAAETIRLHLKCSEWFCAIL